MQTETFNPEVVALTDARFPLQISEEAMRVMQADAEDRFPNECCGFFFGKDGETRHIQEAHIVPNSQEGDQRRRFVISAHDYMKAEKYALKSDLDLLGVYHSHPQHPAIPSIHDLKVAVPGFSYVILSVQDGTFDHIRSWRLNEQDRFVEESLEKEG